jgi:hypothetical protein
VRKQKRGSRAHYCDKKWKGTLTLVDAPACGNVQLDTRARTQLVNPGKPLLPLADTDCTPPEAPTVNDTNTLALPFFLPLTYDMHLRDTARRLRLTTACT